MPRITIEHIRSISHGFYDLDIPDIRLEQISVIVSQALRALQEMSEIDIHYLTPLMFPNIGEEEW
jgi:hypothetical protein